MMKQMHELFPLLHKWGVVGVKSGFVQYATLPGKARPIQKR